MKFSTLVSVTLITAVLCISACSKNSGENNSNPSKLSHKLNQVNDATEFESKYKEALIKYFNSSNANYGQVFIEEGTVASPDAGNGADISESNTPESVSGTNLQEAGVDEADRIKTNGNLLYVLTLPDSQNYPVDATEEDSADSALPIPEYQSNPNSIRIYDVDSANADTQFLSEFEIKLDSAMNANGLYLHQSEQSEHVIVAANAHGQYFPYWYEPYSWGGFRGALVQIDVTNTNNISQLAKVEFSGSIIATRRIGKHLIVASRFFPTIDGVTYFPNHERDKARNVALIDRLDISDLLPTYMNNDGTDSLLSQAENCFVPESADVQGYHPDIISLVSYDLTDLSISHSLCFVGSTETFYASTRAVYLATTRYKWSVEDGMADYASPDVETDIHAFSFDGGDFSYNASGVVKGHLGWNFDLRPFRLSEQDGDLRVITFTGDLVNSESPVRFSILRETSNELITLSTLPNNRRPEAVGKPGEQLYGSRFAGDRVFFVTFRATDPLYILNLSDPTDPFIESELFIDGYSDYLHPVGESLLLGLGKDAIADKLGDGGRGAWFQGVKLSLIDISDPSAPKEVDKKVIGKRGTESPALWSHHAFTYLDADSSQSNPRFAIPLSINETPSGYTGDVGKPWEWFAWTKSGLQLFEIDQSRQVLLDKGLMETANRETADYYGLTGYERSLLTTDAAYFVHGNRVSGAYWVTPEQLNGPR